MASRVTVRRRWRPKVKEPPDSIHRDPAMSNLPLVHAGGFCKAPVLIVTDDFWGLLGEETSWGAAVGRGRKINAVKTRLQGGLSQ